MVSLSRAVEVLLALEHIVVEWKSSLSVILKYENLVAYFHCDTKVCILSLHRILSQHYGEKMSRIRLRCFLKYS